MTSFWTEKKGRKLYFTAVLNEGGRSRRISITKSEVSEVDDQMPAAKRIDSQ
ncbi:hypothetical protein S96127_0220 [Yersinia pestis]|nr:hypothetical protein S96127_0220 [Yersinia pestis]